jgi:hypothetical protein
VGGATMDPAYKDMDDMEVDDWEEEETETED